MDPHSSNDCMIFLSKLANMAITIVYASVSFTKSYFLRKVFEKFEIDDNFIKIKLKIGKRIKLSFDNR